MGSKRAPTLHLFRNGGTKNIGRRAWSHRRDGYGPSFAPPPSFVSALALGMIIGSGSVLSEPAGSCNATANSLTCTGSVTNPSAFSPTGDFTVDIGTTTPTDTPAHIEQSNGFAGIKINAGDFGGTISMTTGSTISVAAGPGTSRNGMVVASYSGGPSRTYTLDIDGTIKSNATDGDALRLEGSSSVIFNATIGRAGHLGGGTGDDAVIVTGAQSLLLTNYGVLEGGSAHPDSGGEGINIGNANGSGERIAADGVTINNYGTIKGTGNAGISGGQGIIAFGAGDVTINNGRRGDIIGASEGIRVVADGDVSITNDGDIKGNSSAGVEIADASTADVTNRSRHSIVGATDGLDIHDVDIANVDNDRGHIIGQDGDGVHINDVTDDVTIKNRFGTRRNAATIEGSANGLSIAEVGGDIAIDNRFGGKIVGHDDDGVHIRDAGSDVAINNSFGGSVSGHDDGVNIRDVDDDVVIDNSFGGRIAGWRDDGVDVSDVRGDVAVSNNFVGTIAGRDNGVQIDHVRDNVEISNAFGGKISGRNGDGINVDRVRDNVAIANVAGEINGGDDGMDVADVGDDLRIANLAGGKILGRYGDGIQADDIDGKIAVTNGGISGISGRRDGVHIRDADDDVSIKNSFGSQIAGRYDDGIDVSKADDDVEIVNQFGSSISGRDNGVQVDDVRDDVTISNSFGSTISGQRGNGVDVRNVRDDVEIANGFGGNISGGDNGVEVQDVRDNVTVTNVAASISGRRDNGVDISNVRGDVEVANVYGSIRGNDAGVRGDDVRGDVALHNWGGEIKGRDDGVHIRDVDDDVEISNSFGGEISGHRGDGVDARDVNDDVEIANAFGGTIRGRDNGIQVENVDDDVEIDNHFGSSISGRRGDGISLSDVNGTVRIDNRFGGAVSGGDEGIKVDDVDGNVTVENDYGSIRGRRDAGIDIEGDGAVTINNGAGTIKGRANAIAIDADTAKISSSGLIRGSGWSAPVIALATASGATINNNDGGVIRGFASSPQALAIEAGGGAITINNAGTIFGRVDLSAAGDTSTPNTFNNSSNNSWHVTGTSELGNGLADDFNNTGTIFTTEPANPALNNVTVLAGVERFDNGAPGATGTIDLQDGHTGDTFTLSPTSGGSLTFNGTPGRSLLKVDSFLGTVPGSSSDSLVIDGSVTGATAIQVNNVNGGFGSFNPVGINVVTATGSSPPNSFYLASGPIDTGMFTYDLYRKGPDEWVLASAPNHAFFELPSLTSAAQSIWHSTAGAWLDRTADLRTALEGTCEIGSLKDPKASCERPTSGAWVKVLGSSESRSRDHSFTVLNTTQKSSVDTQLEGGGVIGGYDLIRSMDDGAGIWLAGVMGGYLRSNLDFDSSPTGAKFEGGAVGGYLTYLSGGWFLDGQVLANIGNVDYSGSFLQKDHANVTSVGGVLDTGYRMAYGSTFIEPGATLSYVNSDIDDLALYGTTVSFSNGDSLRGRIGVRLGTTIVKERAKYEPFIGVGGLYEFLGDNKAGVSSGGYELQTRDNLTGALGEVSGGVNVFSLAGDGLSAFAKGGVQFGKDDYVGYGGTLGVRVDW